MQVSCTLPRKCIRRGCSSQRIMEGPGPRIGSANCSPYGLAVHPAVPSTLYLNAGSQLGRSTNGGTAWTFRPLPSNFYAMNFCLQPGTPPVFHITGYYYDNGLGTTRFGYAKTTDEGLSWSSTILTAGYGYGYGVCVDPTNAQTVYVGGLEQSGQYYYGRVFKSTNGGADFADVSAGIGGYVYDLAHDPVTAGRLYAVTYAGVYRTSNGGGAWTRNSGSLSSTERVGICTLNPAVLYAGTSMGSVYKSTDGGVTWAPFSSGLQGNGTRGLIVENSSTVFVATSAGVFATANGGSFWGCCNTGLSAARITSVRYAPSQPSVVYACVSGDAVYKTSGAGQATVTWSRIPDFYSCTEVADMLISETNPDVLYALEGGT